MKSNSLPAQFSLSHRLYRILTNKRNVMISKDLQPLTMGDIQIKIEDITFCQNDIIHKLFAPLKPYSEFVQVFLHGSWADDTRTAFSDIDDYVILDIKSLKEQNLLAKVLKILNRIDMNFCRIDAIQHHGHWLCSMQELLNYDNSFMPLSILKESECVVGKNIIEGNINTELSRKGLKNNIINTCIGIRKLSELYFNDNINAYELKGLVGSFALMPAFIFQIDGEDCTKPEAIKRAKTFYSDEAISCIQWSTDNRNNWSNITKTSRYRAFSALSHLCFDPHVWRRLSKKYSPRITKKQNDQLSSISITMESINKFISESLKYAK